MSAVHSKQQQLFKWKAIATSLFVVMAFVFIGTHFISGSWVGYVRAFSEAAMVGALADWFAVTALFRHPLGLPIPHTNLIEQSKGRIGNNLGQFVSDNFLTPEVIKPRLANLTLSKKLAHWLLIDSNRHKVITELTAIVTDAVNNISDEEIAAILQHHGKSIIEALPLEKIAGAGLSSVLASHAHQNWVTILATKVAQYVQSNQELVKEKVKSESHFLIPGFVDNLVASKISRAAIKYFEALAQSHDHPLRKDITTKLTNLAKQLEEGTLWKEDFASFRQQLMQDANVEKYASALGIYLKEKIVVELKDPQGAIAKYLEVVATRLAYDLDKDIGKQQRLDGFVQKQIHKLIINHKQEVAELIGITVGNWQDRDLSEKLELEVGKDLQFIRINGTLVGGLVGLLIYQIVQWLS